MSMLPRVVVVVLVVSLLGARLYDALSRMISELRGSLFPCFLWHISPTSLSICMYVQGCPWVQPCESADPQRNGRQPGMMFVSTTTSRVPLIPSRLPCEPCHASILQLRPELTSTPTSLANLVNTDLLTDAPSPLLPHLPHPVPHPVPHHPCRSPQYSPCPAYVDNHFQYPFAGSRADRIRLGCGWCIGWDADGVLYRLLADSGR